MGAKTEFVTSSFELFTSRVCVIPFMIGLASGTMGALLHIYDSSVDNAFLVKYVPDDVVFNVFVVFGGLVAGFRTSHALSRYTDAAAFLHKLNACWYDAASTLIAFCRNSAAPTADVVNFEHTLIRLMSILSALCLDGLQQRDGNGVGHRFEVIGAEELDDETQAAIFESDHKVECVFQMIQQVVVDAIETKVLSIAPPILSRSFQEMGAGLLTYHEAKKLACVPMPKAYLFFTATILTCEALFVPWMLAIYTKGTFSTFFYTFSGVFLLWFLNFVAGSLDNPFQKEARTLESSNVQRELNQHLLQILAQAQLPAAYTDFNRPSQAAHTPRRSSFHTWRTEQSAATRKASMDAMSDAQSGDRSVTERASDPRVRRSRRVGSQESSDSAPKLQGEWQQIDDPAARGPSAPRSSIPRVSFVGDLPAVAPSVPAGQGPKCSAAGASTPTGGTNAVPSDGRDTTSDTGQAVSSTRVPDSPPRRLGNPGSRDTGDQPVPSTQAPNVESSRGAASQPQVAGASGQPPSTTP